MILIFEKLKAKIKVFLQKKQSETFLVILIDMKYDVNWNL